MKRLFAACLLLALPLAQAHALFACPMHNAEADCFCPVEHRIPAAPEPAAFEATCCDHAVVEPDHALATSSATVAESAPKKPVGGSGVPAVAVTSPVSLISLDGRLEPPPATVVSPRDQSRLYLETARLRL